MFSTWSATEASSTIESSDSPAAKRRRISESTHGRRTSKATRACDVCKVNTFLLCVPRCEMSLGLGPDQTLLMVQMATTIVSGLPTRHARFGDMLEPFEHLGVYGGITTSRLACKSSWCDLAWILEQRLHSEYSLTFHRQRKLDAQD
jgi:hypothetical protein